MDHPDLNFNTIGFNAPNTKAGEHHDYSSEVILEGN